MLSKKDIQVLREMFTENNREWDKRLDIRFSDFKHEIRDEIRSCIAASESRMTKMMHEVRDEILEGVADIVGNEILPQIDNHESRLLILEQRVA